MKIEKLEYDLTVCKLKSEKDLMDLMDSFYFVGRTDEEISLVCRTELTPADTIQREDGWKAFRIKGELDFSLVGILAKIATLLADNEISIFAVSTFNTDYILVKQEKFESALRLLIEEGYTMI